jgi:hypothetical protein
MDVLVAEAKIIKHPVPQKGSLRQGCLSPKVGQGHSTQMQGPGYCCAVQRVLFECCANHQATDSMQQPQPA